MPETNYAKIDVQHFIEWSWIACESVATCPWRESDDRNKTEIVPIYFKLLLKYSFYTTVWSRPKVKVIINVNIKRSGNILPMFILGWLINFHLFSPLFSYK